MQSYGAIAAAMSAIAAMNAPAAITKVSEGNRDRNPRET